MEQVFISRHLGKDSFFRQHLEAAGYAVESRSLIIFEAVPFEGFPATDWIFFYSRRSVCYFFEGITGLPLTQWAVIGPGTAAALQQQGQQPDFTGTGDPDETATAFLEVARGQRVLFPRARHSRRSVQRRLAGKIQTFDLVVYDNRPATDLPRKDYDILVFTSPMNVEAFCRQRNIQQWQHVVAIGKTTTAALEKKGVSNIVVAATPSEESLAKAVIELGGTKNQRSG